ncbi:DUF4350 domain-containing protein [Flavobacterium sp. Sd200]|uniref:DUF4350 domain-containing protein n=1 Tax=Flavobacterium sp. Sd200 TaxID=2692211 RepID=UPI00136F6904|nr:DUF4350 domain-containing protein [Flavobacterium sp. Sd200]MXN90434.1 DUF4350 domain-containing protein [Flavobacterium sp. Sd200]
MNRKLTLYIVLLAVVAGLLVFIDNSRPKPVDWSPTYAVKDKIPLGLYIFNKEIPDLFLGDTIEKFRVTPYEYFINTYDEEADIYSASGSFIAIGENNEIDDESVTELLYFAAKGNTLFLSQKTIPQTILDTLNLKTNFNFIGQDSIKLTTEKYNNKEYWFKEGSTPWYFDSIVPDSVAKGQIKILGHQELKGEKQTNFIEARFGNGRIVLHTQPSAFSNFHLLKKDHYQYTQALVSQIPKGTIYWQNTSVADEISSSPLRYILSQPALKWAFWLGLMGLLIFIIFNAKRKQRVVPVIEPLRNTTVDFARTIGNLYYQEGNHHTIIEKKIIYFLEHIRTEYLIDTYTLDDAFAEKLHLKTGRPLEDIQEALSLIRKHRHNFTSTEADLAAINNAIEKLKS